MRSLFAAIVVFAAGAAGCTEGASPLRPDDVVCTTQYVFGLAVTVQDRTSGQRVCDAEVVAVAASFRETLQAFGAAESCTYAGAGERPGLYEIRASKPGYQAATATNVRVNADQCHVVPARVTLELAR